MGIRVFKFRHWAAIALWLYGAAAIAACQDPKINSAPDTESLIAVATNFRVGFEALEADFESRSPYHITGVYGGTGQLFTQIISGANYHAFLAADQARPQKLTDSGRGIAGAQSFIYAQGRLALWTRSDNALVSAFTPAEDYDAPAVLTRAEITRLAIANPKLAPYGAAAMETIKTLGLGPRLSPQIVQGENAGQAFALAATGNAQAGLIALADAKRAKTGIYWEVPDYLHSPIDQSAILLSETPSARAFLAYLRTPAARDIIRAHGYQIAGESGHGIRHEN
jgi:molybdate transport system substrate-binding protein